MPYGLNVVLIEPKIPMNTGSIGRLCLATGCTLHLVEPLGFEISDRQLKRAGLDYWQFVSVVRHENRDRFFESLPPGARAVFFSTKADQVFFEHRFEKGDYLIFGSETEGLDEDLRTSRAAEFYRIPQYDERVRSINLACAVSVVVYEAIRQLGP
jgi:tRNA (cytidine/uridine-2'-O-)-methyltransferase